jgi:hypothetical protein
VVNYIKNNVLLIALLAIAIYQQFLLNDLLSLARYNELAILQTKDLAWDLKTDTEQLRIDVELMRVDIDTLPLLID